MHTLHTNLIKKLLNRGEILMTRKDFVLMYDESLRHGWVTSKIASVAAKQKEREQEYNRNYYRNHSDKWNRRDRVISGKYRPSNLVEQFKQRHPYSNEYSKDGVLLGEDQWNSQLKLLEDYDKKYNGSASSMASKAEQIERTRSRSARDYGRQKAIDEKKSSIINKINSMIDRAGMTLVLTLRKSGHSKAAKVVDKIVNDYASRLAYPVKRGLNYNGEYYN